MASSGQPMKLSRPLDFLVVTTARAPWLARLPVRVPRWSGWVTPYAIGTIAMFWVAERVASF